MMPAATTVQASPLQHLASKQTIQKILLACGILSSLLYVAANIIVPLQYPGYSSFSQAVSELSAIGAPTRSLWITFIAPYGLLLFAFGCGVWLSSANSRALKIVAVSLIVQSIVGAFWPPMHMRGAPYSLTDSLHIAFTAVWLVFTILAIVSAATALGKLFRLYSILTLVTLLFFGALTGIQAPALAANQPTPWMGVWERINIGVFMLWIIVLATALLSSSTRPKPKQCSLSCC